MATIKRRTTEQLIESTKNELKKLELRLKNEKKSKKSNLDKKSIGVQEAIATLEKVVKENKSSMGEVIKLISKIKRTGLQIEDPKKKQQTVETSTEENSNGNV
jgi:hypothetical protein